MNAHELSTLFAPVPAAEPVVADIRREHDWPAREGVPAHVTLLGPFLPPREIDDDVVDRLAGLFATRESVGVSLSELRRVDDIAYLAVEPDDGLRSLTSMLEEAFPPAPRYGEEFGGPLYHVTIARECDDTLFSALSDLLSGALPIQAIIEEVVLVEHGALAGVRERGRFRFRDDA